MTYTVGQIALANQNITPNQRIIEFHGYEGEDFRHFQEVLESYLLLNNITNEARKMSILKSQLRGPAKVYLEKEILTEYPEITFNDALAKMKEYYITHELIQAYELEFNEMYQGEQEHPRVFLARLREAAQLAEIKDNGIIESRFRAGLLPEIKQFCIQSSSRNLKDWFTHADGWWNAHRPRKISMVNNPFLPRNANQALIYHEPSHQHHAPTNHNIELVDAIPQATYPTPIDGVLSTSQLANMNVHGRHAQYSRNNYHQTSQQGHTNNSSNQQDANINQQQELIDLIQKTIRMELNNQPQYQQPSRNYNRNHRYNNNYNDYNNNNRYGRSNNYNNRYNPRTEENYSNQQQSTNQNQQSKN